jgi:tetratricopeptide (TPR) repeat protein
MGRLTLLMMLMCGGPAFAQETDQERAKELYSNGKRLFGEERHKEALVAWEAAYKISERPLLLFNMALAQEQLGQLNQAIETLYQYRVFAPAGEQDMLVEKIAELKALVAQEPTEPEPVQVAEPEPKEAPKPEAAPSNNRRLGPALAWTATGVAAASGLTFGLLAYSSGQSADEYCGDSSEGTFCINGVEDYEYQQNSRALVADISWGVAAVGLGTGLWMARRGSEPAGTVQAQFGLGFIGLRGGF